jgi:hypothetical protein
MTSELIKYQKSSYLDKVCFFVSDSFRNVILKMVKTSSFEQEFNERTSNEQKTISLSV